MQQLLASLNWRCNSLKSIRRNTLNTAEVSSLQQTTAKFVQEGSIVRPLMMLCHFKKGICITNKMKAKGGVIRLYTNTYTLQEKKSKYCLEIIWENAYSRWRHHKEQDLYHRCTTCQKQTETHATCTTDITFNKKILLSSVQYIDRAVQPVLQATEKVSLQTQQLSSQQQEHWLYFTWQMQVFFVHPKCTSETSHVIV